MVKNKVERKMSAHMAFFIIPSEDGLEVYTSSSNYGRGGLCRAKGAKKWIRLNGLKD
jgi:hypothetical protein